MTFCRIAFGFRINFYYIVFTIDIDISLGWRYMGGVLGVRDRMEVFFILFLKVGLGFMISNARRMRLSLLLLRYLYSSTLHISTLYHIVILVRYDTTHLTTASDFTSP